MVMNIAPGVNHFGDKKRSKRIVVRRACDRCKLRKSKCTGIQPCHACCKARSDCTYLNKPLARGLQKHRVSTMSTARCVNGPGELNAQPYPTEEATHEPLHMYQRQRTAIPPHNFAFPPSFVTVHSINPFGSLCGA